LLFGPDVRFGSEADSCSAATIVRYGPITDISATKKVSLLHSRHIAARWHLHLHGCGHSDAAIFLESELGCRKHQHTIAIEHKHDSGGVQHRRRPRQRFLNKYNESDCPKQSFRAESGKFTRENFCSLFEYLL